MSYNRECTTKGKTRSDTNVVRKPYLLYVMNIFGKSMVLDRIFKWLKFVIHVFTITLSKPLVIITDGVSSHVSILEIPFCISKFYRWFYNWFIPLVSFTVHERTLQNRIFCIYIKVGEQKTTDSPKDTLTQVANSKG